MSFRNSNKECSVQGCSTRHNIVRGLCNKHYLRWWQYGDPEHVPIKPSFKHGGAGTPEYRIYKGMKARCGRPSNPSYKDYGARGIFVCAEWSADFSAFIKDMGPRPSPKHTIERIDNDGPYAPWNCRWATQAEQNTNTRVTRRVILDGETIHLSEAARRLGRDQGYVRRRIADDGMTVVMTPPMRRPRRQLTNAEISLIRKRIADGEARAALAREFSISDRHVNEIAPPRKGVGIAFFQEPEQQ